MADQVYPVNHNDEHPPDVSWEENPASTSRLMSQEGVFQLTQDLRKFSETLTNLKTVFCEEKDVLEQSQQSLRVAAHERLGELLKVLKNIVNKYPELDSHGILSAAENLINYIKNFNYESEEENVPPEIHTAINNLALAFSSSVSECLIGDINIRPSLVQSQSVENLPTQNQPPGHQRQFSQTFDTVPEDNITAVDYPLATSETVADVLAQVTENLDICFERAKAWSKYANDLMTYVKKKAHIEMEYAKQLTKLSQTTRAVLSEQSFLPFQSLYCTALDNDKEYASNVISTQQNLILAQKFIEPLQAKRLDHDRQHKSLRDAWRKDKRRLEEAEVNLKKAKHQYQTRKQEYQKAKEASIRADHQLYGSSQSDAQHTRQGSNPGSTHLSLGSVVAPSALPILPTSKVEKKKRQEDDSFLKAIQAEQLYRACVDEANSRRKELERKEEQYLKTLRDLMTQCDQTTKAVTLSFFQVHYDLTSPLRVQYQALLDESRNYEPGFQYAEYLKHLTPHQSQGRLDYQFEPYAVEGAPYMEQTTAPRPDDSSPLSGRSSQTGRFSHARRLSHKGFSDTESSSSRSLDDISPSASPGDPPNRKDMYKRRPSTEGSLSSEEILDETPKDPPDSRLVPPSLENTSSYSPESSPAPPRTQFPKVMKAVANAFKGMKRAPKPTVFGVDFSVAAQDSPDGVPLLIKKCIAEIDNRALTVKGIYRVNGVKNRVEKLCSLLDTPNCLKVDLSEHLPHDISGVLKYYLRQLPEPLMLYKLYNDLLDAAKNYHEYVKEVKAAEAADPVDQDSASDRVSPQHDLHNERLSAALDKMKVLVHRLPLANQNTLQYIIAHLSRVTEHCSTNMMNASNLAIIFGPTLLRPVQETGNELQTLIELPMQSHAIEMLISHRNKIFDTYGNQAHVEEMKDRIKTSTTTEEFDSGEGPRHPNSQSHASTLSSASSGEPLATTEQVHVVIDETGEFPPLSEVEGAQSNSFSGDGTIGQSNGGMVDGRGTLFPNSSGIRKSSSSRDVPGAISAFSDEQTSHDDLSIKSTSNTKASYLAPTSYCPRPTSLLPQKFAKQDRESPNKQRVGSPQKFTLSSEANGTVTDDPLNPAPVAPVRLKSKQKKIEKKSVILDFPLNPDKSVPHNPGSPHRPRSRRITDSAIFQGAGQKETKENVEKSRRTSVAVSPKLDHPSTKAKRPSTIATLIHPTAYQALDETKVKVNRRLPQVPTTKNAASSPSRPQQISMPGRTPPFNKTQTWSFAKSDTNSERGVQISSDPVQKKILMEEDNEEEVSFC